MVLACVGMWVRHVEDGPICAAAGTCPSSCLGEVLYTDEHSLLDGPGLAVYLFVNNVKLVGVHGMSCGGTVVVYGGRGLEMFLNSFPQGSARLPNVGAGAVDMWALVFVGDACLVGFWVLILGVPQGCSKGVGVLEVDLDSSAFA